MTLEARFVDDKLENVFAAAREAQKEIRKHKIKLDKRRRRLEENARTSGTAARSTTPKPPARDSEVSQPFTYGVQGLRRLPHAALRMEEVVREWTENVTQDTIAEDRSTKTMDWLVKHMASAWKIPKSLFQQARETKDHSRRTIVEGDGEMLLMPRKANETGIDHEI
ncbi:hypothetical protein MMC07_004622 [Pseudocyphellaria aurata]|nr:hypothetical protein [Pseudocyphellaria aurata]